MSISYYYFGHDTLTKIRVGSGRSAWAKWNLWDHEGPIICLDYMGGAAGRYVYLTKELLGLLYQRFRQANPSGATLLGGDLFEVDFLSEKFSEKEQEEMYERRIALFSINVEDSEKKYPHLRPYLPELFDPSVLEKLARDPWLDAELLIYSQNLGPERGGIASNLWKDRSARWSPEWCEFCQSLNPNFWSPEAGWKTK
jgi:hypothetical protein